MLKPSQCFAGPISAAKGLTLVLPRSQYENLALIVPVAEKLYAVCLDDAQGASKFAIFECDANDRWQGLLIPNVDIELDEGSLRIDDRPYPPIGSLTRKGEALVINGTQIGNRAGRPQAVTVMDGLPPCIDLLTASFTKWQVVLGSGLEKRILHKIEVE